MNPPDVAEPPNELTFEGRPLPHPDEPVFDQGLQFDIETLLDRRRVLKLFGYGAISLGLAACVPGASASPSSTATGASPFPSPESCDVIPEETAGPFPGDGSNGPDILGESGVVRSDIRSSFGSSTATAAGVPLTIRIQVQDSANGCAPLAGAAVYLWHCTRDGEYSMYGQSIANENFLRGVQAAGDDGIVAFESVFPGCYPSRWPHIHFEVYPSLEAATDVSNKIATSQIALPEAICAEVYATAGYEQSVQSLAGLSLERDMVFGEDGGAQQLGTISGSLAGGLTVELAVPVSA